MRTIHIRVRCNGRLHRIRWRRGRLQLLDHHSLRTLRLHDLLGNPTRCGQILTAIRSRSRTCQHPFPGVPQPLRQALQTHLQARLNSTHGKHQSRIVAWTTMRHRLFIQAITRRYGTLVSTLQTAGLKVALQVESRGALFSPILCPWPDGPTLATRKEKVWHLDFTELDRVARNTMGDSADPFWGDRNHCRVCQRTYAISPSYPFAMSRHAATTKHITKIRAILVAALIESNARDSQP